MLSTITLLFSSPLEKRHKTPRCVPRILQQRLRALNGLEMVRGGLSYGYRGLHIQDRPAAHRSGKMSHTGEVSRQVLHAKNNDMDGSSDGRQQQAPCCLVEKSPSGSNNPSVTYELFKKGTCGCKRASKCRDVG